MGGNTEFTYTKNNVEVPDAQSTVSISRVIAEDGDMNGIGVLSESVRFRQLEPDPDPELEPVIFIPGIAASTLKLNGSELWLDVSLIPNDRKKQLTLNSSDMNYPRSAVKATDVLREPSGGPVYKPLLDYLDSLGYTSEHNYGVAGCNAAAIDSQTKLFIFPYDWRDSNIDNAALLDGYVQCIRSVHGEDARLNIIAHSMGGLLARRYVRDHPEQISKLITIGTPWLGAPKAIHTMGTGEFMDGSLFRRLAFQQAVISRDLLRRLVEYFPGVHELLPSRTYFENAGDPGAPIPFENPDTTGTAIRVAPCPFLPATCDYFDFRDTFDITLFPQSRPVRKNEDIHGQMQDNWSNDQGLTDPPRATVFHVFGNGKLTISKVTLAEELDTRFASVHATGLGVNPGVGLNAGNLPVLQPGGGLTWQSSVEFLPESSTSGDGTVTSLSASRKTGTVNLNTPRAELKEIHISDPGVTEKDVEHTGLTQSSLVHEYIGCVLAPWTQDIQDCVLLAGEPAL
jgi:pimeloyl-ACP methyl ester carboxylesterase